MTYMNRETSIGITLVMLFLAGIGAVDLNCSSKKDCGAPAVCLVFKHGKIPGEPQSFRKLLRRFEELNPGITVRDEILPSSTDEQHQYYVINLEGGRADFDVFSMDVIWVPEFSRAGWLLDITDALSEKDKREMFPGPVQAVTRNGRLYALPWYIDAGLLFYRRDILARHGFSSPRTWMELVSISKALQEREPGIYGFIWQGKQYEGIVCNALEFINKVFKEALIIGLCQIFVTC